MSLKLDLLLEAINETNSLMNGYKDQLDHIKQTCAAPGQREYVEKQIESLEETITYLMQEKDVYDKIPSNVSKDGKKRRYVYTEDCVWTEADQQVQLPSSVSKYVFAKSKIDAKRLFEYRFRKYINNWPVVVLSLIDED